MPKFRKRPVVIEAVQWTGANPTAVIELASHSCKVTFDYAVELDMFLRPDGRPVNEKAPLLKIETLEGVMIADPGDWVIKGVKGELYPCKPDIFAATYDSLPEQYEANCELCQRGEPAHRTATGTQGGSFVLRTLPCGHTRWDPETD